MRANHRTRFSILAVACLAAGLGVAPTFGAGPLLICESGQPFLWGNGGANIPFNPDQGDLAVLTNAQATALVQEAFDRWTAVPSSSASYINAGQLPVDVDITNFGPFLNPPAPDGLSPIVFDDTGEIFDLLFGPNSGVLGFATPEFAFVAPDCEIFEGQSFLNGPAFGDLIAARDVMVHEFGHYSNLAHVAVNGQIFLAGDTSGPTPFNTFGSPILTQIATMYPFLFLGADVSSPAADDIASISTLYPEADFFSTTGTITGTIFAANGTTKLTGVNVIARNIADPFNDAVSALSSDFTDDFSQSDPFTGFYTLNNLTPGAQYAVFVDEILAGGFSTPPLSPLPNDEEFASGPNESSDASIDDPSVFTPFDVSAGAVTAGVDVIFNTFAPGQPLPVGIDGFVELPLPFEFELCGFEFNSVFVNANGNLTFGVGSTDFTESAPEMLAGPPRIAAHWDDLNATAGGAVTFEQSKFEFKVRWDNVPEFPATGANTFSITLHRIGDLATLDYGALTATDGLAGFSCGGTITTGLEPEIDLTNPPRLSDDDDDDDDDDDLRLADFKTFGKIINGFREAAIYEVFTEADNDLADEKFLFILPRRFRDRFEPNDSLRRARFVSLPFDTVSTRRFTTIDPLADDIDFFRFRAKAGQSIVASTIGGQLDTLIGLFNRKTGEMLAVDDDGGAGLLSRIVFPVEEKGDFALAVTTFPDFDFTGDGGSGGRYALDIQVIDGLVLPLVIDSSVEVPFGFDFPFQGGTENSVFVNAAGNLTFGAGNIDFSESIADLLNGPPRIAGLWDDLNPGAGLVIVNEESDSLSIEFRDVPEFLANTTNNFTLTLRASGEVNLDFGDVAALDALVGLSPGGGAADPGATDLSTATGLSSDGTTYELFDLVSPFDLQLQSLSFKP